MCVNNSIKSFENIRVRNLLSKRWQNQKEKFSSEETGSRTTRFNRPKTSSRTFTITSSSTRTELVLVLLLYKYLTVYWWLLEVVAAPISLHIPAALAELTSKVQIAAQNCSDKDFGAFTGEISYLRLLITNFANNVISQTTSYQGLWSQVGYHRTLRKKTALQRNRWSKIWLIPLLFHRNY